MTSAQRVRILLSENSDRKTNNLVYPKILLWLPQAYQDKIIHKSIKYNDEPNCEFDFLLNLIHIELSSMKLGWYRCKSPA